MSAVSADSTAFINSTSNANSYALPASGSITSGRWMFLCVITSGASGAITVSDNRSGTWTPIKTEQTFGSNNRKINVFQSKAAATQTYTITIAANGGTGCSAQLLVGDANVHSTIPVRQAASNSASSTTNHNISWRGPTDTTCAFVCVAGQDKNATDMTAPYGAVDYNLSFNTPATNLNLSHKNGGDAFNPVGVTLATAQACGLMIFEVRDTSVAMLNFNLTAAAGGCTYTGRTETKVVKGYKVAGAAASFTVNGQIASLKTGRKLAADAGDYDWVGIAAGLFKGYKTQAGTGPFVLTGQAATLTQGGGAGHPTMPADAGAYVLTGFAVTLKMGRKVIAATGPFALTGVAAGFKRTYVLAAGTGSRVLSGQAATLKRGLKLAAGVGAYALGGQTATFRRGFSVLAGTGAYALNGQAAQWKWMHVLGAGTAQYVLTGRAAGMFITYPAVFALQADAGSCVVSPSPAGLSYWHTVPACDWNSAEIPADVVSFVDTGTTCDVEFKDKGV